MLFGANASPRSPGKSDNPGPRLARPARSDALALPVQKAENLWGTLAMARHPKHSSHDDGA